MEQVLTPILQQLINEQADPMAAAPAPAGPAGPGPEIETNNTPGSSDNSPFTPAEKKFLGKFDADGTKQLGVIYSISDIGIREFLNRSRKDLNLNSAILLSLLHNGIIKVIPYTGWGRNDDYTIELQLSLNDVKGLGAADKEKAEKGSQSSGAAAGGAAPMGGMEVSWVVKYGDVLRESAKIIKNYQSKPLSEAKKSEIDVFVDKSRMLRQFPKEFIRDLKRIIARIDKKMHTSSQKERLIADILDNLQVNLKLTPKQVKQSFEFHKDQKRLNKYLEKSK